LLGFVSCFAQPIANVVPKFGERRKMPDFDEKTPKKPLKMKME